MDMDHTSFSPSFFLKLERLDSVDFNCHGGGGGAVILRLVIWFVVANFPLWTLSAQSNDSSIKAVDEFL